MKFHTFVVVANRNTCGYCRGQATDPCHYLDLTSAESPPTSAESPAPSVPPGGAGQPYEAAKR